MCCELAKITSPAFYSWLLAYSHGNTVIPFHLRSSFWNAKLDCSHRSGTITYRFLLLFRRKCNRSVPQLFPRFFVLFLATKIHSWRLEHKSYCFAFSGCMGSYELGYNFRISACTVSCTIVEPLRKYRAFGPPPPIAMLIGNKCDFSVGN